MRRSILMLGLLATSCANTEPESVGHTSAPLEVEVAADVGDELLDGEYNGLWHVTAMTCGGESPNAGTENLYTAPNKISVRINDSTGAFIDSVNGCDKTIPLAFLYPTDNHMTASFSGAIECSPANCDTGCGLLLPLTVAYEVERVRNTLYWTSVGPVDDNCSKNGQANPIDYTMKKRGR